MLPLLLSIVLFAEKPLDLFELRRLVEQRLS